MRDHGAKRSLYWACYHTELYELELESGAIGVLGCAVGAPFAVLVAEELFASGCEFLISVTSAGQIVPAGKPPYFVFIDKALRDEGNEPSLFAALVLFELFSEVACDRIVGGRAIRQLAGRRQLDDRCAV